MAPRTEFYSHLAAQLRKSPTNFLQTEPQNLKVDEFRPQDHSISSTIEGFATEDSIAAEILDYRIAEKIENDLREKENLAINHTSVTEALHSDARSRISESLEDEIPKILLKKKRLPRGSKKLLPKVKPCSACGERHEQDECPLRRPLRCIDDKLDYPTWRLQNKEEQQEVSQERTEDGEEQHHIPTYSELSLPDEFEIGPSTENPSHGLSIYSRETIPKYTRLGPLRGVEVQESDLADDCTMRFIFETFDGEKSHFVDVEDKNESNWLRYLRPAGAKETRNVSLTVFDEQIYFVTCVDLSEGVELLYSSDETNSAWTKRVNERMSCGGCNLKFEHPIYYRTHCSVFHDVGFSLTIKKYHCKICKISVLGKENIMKHAEQMHDGKGAYQCQFCKKFFLRLNYLDMHRTYGCSANPQRARPLCDFCGRKFCQPQKLKVHIKRMHSDITDVLRDFQCKLCSKLLGSRAALQRHSKEVHNRDSGFVNCPRCQKLFQNRSNLKIHMLTHSGVRPFKCSESECSAAFTTKQCLQFHYKKVHGYTQEQMPKIERSVAYTFDAYSGGLKDEIGELDDKMYKPRKRREKSISVPENFASETSSTMTQSCQLKLEELPLEEKKPETMDEFSSYENTMVEQPIIDDDSSTIDFKRSEDQPQTAPKPDETPLYRAVENALPSEEDDEEEETEDVQTNQTESISEVLSAGPQYPYGFVQPQRSEDANQMSASSNFNPLTSAFSAHPPSSSLLNFFSPTNKNRPNLPTSAMLVEAALNSVSEASNEFVSNAPEENHVDIESVSRKATGDPRLELEANQYMSDENSVDETDYQVKVTGNSISSNSVGSSASKKSTDLPLDIAFARKSFQQDTSGYDEDRQDFSFHDPPNSGATTCLKSQLAGTFPPVAAYNGGSLPGDNDFQMSHDYKKCFAYIEEMKSLNDSLVKDPHKDPYKLKDDHLDMKFKRKDLLLEDFRNSFASTTPMSNATTMYNLNFKPNDYHANELSMSAAPSAMGASYGRYQHHIHDILSSEKQEQQMHLDSQQQQHQSQDAAGYLYDTEQQSINLCKTAQPDYGNACLSPAMPQNYSAGDAGMLGNFTPASPSPIHHHPSFHHGPRDALSDHQRLLASDKFVTSRLLVDPVAHRFIEQHNRLMDNQKLDPKLGLYHPQQLAGNSYEPKAANNLHSNYHHLPFPTYYQ